MKRVCRQCKVFIEDGRGNCQICSNSDFATSWQGRLSIVDSSKSFIGKKVGIAKSGDYVLKLR